LIVEAKKKYGFPEKFRTCWGKNTDENIFRIAGMLHEHDLEKGITLARQSQSKEVLGNIKRGNINRHSPSRMPFLACCRCFVPRASRLYDFRCCLGT